MPSMVYEFIPPITPRIMARRLLGLHRNSAQIQYLNLHLNGRGGLNWKEDIIVPETLPEGTTPVMILREEGVTNSEILRLIEEGGFISKGQGVTVVRSDRSDEQGWPWPYSTHHCKSAAYSVEEGMNSAIPGVEEIDIWCGKDHNRRKLVRADEMTGCEDDVIIIFDTFYNEDMNRARETLIIVSTSGSQ